MNNSEKELFEKINNNNTTIKEMQKYINEVLKIRGFNDQSIQNKMLLLLEETGELAKAIRKNLPEASVDLARIQNYDSIESEVADVFIVLTSICNKLNIDLYESIINKEKENINRTWKINKWG